MINNIKMRSVQYPNALNESDVIFKNSKMGFPMYVEAEPVIANTIIIITICQLDEIPQRSFNLFTNLL